MDPITTGMLISGGASLVGGLLGGQSSGASPEELMYRQRDMMNDANRPYRTLGKKGASGIQSMYFPKWGGNEKQRNQYLSQYGSDWANKIGAIGKNPATSLTGFAIPNLTTPKLQNNVSVNLANDPIYQQQVKQGMGQLNRRYASMGSANSSDADNAVARNMLDYYTNAYGRAEGDVNRYNQNALQTANMSNENALSKYGLQYNRANDIYNRDYSNTMAQYGLTNNAEQNYYDRLFNLSQMGANTAAGQASNLTASGNTLAQMAMQGDMNRSNSLQTGIAGVLGAYNNYSLMNYLNQSPSQQLPYSSGQSANNMVNYAYGTGIPGR